MSLDQIIDDISASLIDDPIEDFKYLRTEKEKYSTHEFAEDIERELGKLMYTSFPETIRKGVEYGSIDSIEDFNAMLDIAEEELRHGRWKEGGTILKNLIGDGLAIDDDEETEYRCLDQDQEIQTIIYEKFFKSERNLEWYPVDFARLYGLYGIVLMEYGQIESAREVLEISMHYNPLNFQFFFEYVETFKIQGDFETVDKLSREYLKYAYRTSDIGHLYRNLGFVYIEKEEYNTALMLFHYSLAYDPGNKVAENELLYIDQATGITNKEPEQEEADAMLEKENIQIGASKEVIQSLYNHAYIESHLHQDKEKTEYFCSLLYDLTRSDDLVKGFYEALEPNQDPIFTYEDPDPDYHPYEDARDRVLSPFFPDYPKIDDCRLRIEFSVGTTKYSETAFLIEGQIEEQYKLIEDNHISLYFPNGNETASHLLFIEDIITVAGKWKSFELTINERLLDASGYHYLTDYVRDYYKLKGVWRRDAETIRKEYKRAAAPPKAKKERPEDSVKIDFKGSTPKEILRGVVMIFADLYLKDCDVQSYTVSDEEYVLVADDKQIFDFWLSPYPEGATIAGESDGRKPYDFCTFVIQELTPNSTIKYNQSAFKDIFFEVRGGVLFLKFHGADYYVDEVNHFHKIDKALPELDLQGRYDRWPGELYHLIVFEMDDAAGKTCAGIGYTNKKEKDLLKKVCKGLEKANVRSLELNGLNGLDYRESKDFIKAFVSLKGETKKKRLENHLRYFVIDKTIKEETELYTIPGEIMNAWKAGEYKDVERFSYADIGRR